MPKSWRSAVTYSTSECESIHSELMTKVSQTLEKDYENERLSQEEIEEIYEIAGYLVEPRDLGDEDSIDEYHELTEGDLTFESVAMNFASDNRRDDWMKVGKFIDYFGY